MHDDGRKAATGPLRVGRLDARATEDELLAVVQAQGRHVLRVGQERVGTGAACPDEGEKPIRPPRPGGEESEPPRGRLLW